MARLPRLSVPGWPHLVLQLGHSRQPVFRDDTDRTLFLELLRDAARAYNVAIHAYALLDSEVRLLGTPKDASGLSRMMQGLGRRYGGHFNRRHGHVGTLWEGRFRATVIEPERHLLDSMRFIEEDTDGAAVAGSASARSPYSSAGHHLGQRVDPLVSDHPQYWSLGNTPFEREVAYRTVLERGLSAAQRAELRNAVLKSWPLGSPAFIDSLSATTARRLAPLRRGRPPKSTKQV